MYARFAYVYDELMRDVPYNKWLQFVESERQVNQLNGNRILEIACGTGELSVLLAQNDFDVTGVDLSSDMLMVAYGKAEKGQTKILHFMSKIWLNLKG